MRHFNRIRLLMLAMSLGVTVVVLMMVGLSTATATGDVDFTLDVDAPAHVAVSSTYEVKIIYYNLGTGMAPDAWVTAVLPEGAQFVTATDRWGDPLPPGTVDGSTLTWTFDEPMCHKPLDACCGHIVITLHTDEDLPEETVLETVASVGTSVAESDTTNNVDSAVTLIGAMAGSTKQVHARHVMPGGVLTYLITIDFAHQPGSATWRDVVLTDTLPFSHQVRFLGWNGAITGTMIDGHQLRWQGRVQAGEPLTLQYRLGVEGVITPGTVISNVAMLGWEGGYMQLGPVTTVVTLPHGTMALGPYQGGQMYHQYGVSLTVPPGAVTDTTRFQFRPLLTDTVSINPPGGLLFANRAFELSAFRFGEPVREFSRPLTITMNYTDTDVVGLKRETLRLWTRTDSDGPWAVLGEPVRVMSGALAFTTPHFSQFALFGEAEATTGNVDLAVELEAPAHVAVSSTVDVRVVYYNLGSSSPSDAWVTATLPEGTQFITATDRWEDPLPPDAIDGNVLSWYFADPSCYTPLNANCGHILIALHTDDLPEGTVLTTTASVGTTDVESDTTNNENYVVSLIGAMAGSTKQVQARHAMPGDVLSYTITLDLAHYPGGKMWQDVVLTDTLPFSHQVRFLGWHGTVTGTMIDGHKLRWQGRVQAGEPLTLQYRLGVEGVVTPGTVISNVAMLGWEGGHMQLGPVTTVVTLPHGTMALGPYQGGQMYHQYGVSLTVPPGAVTDTTRFQFRPLLTGTHPITPPGGLLFANRAFELNAFRFGQPVREFSRPLTITMNYTDADVAGLKRETLQLWTRTGPNGPWAMLGQPARVMSGALAFTTPHFSQFALFGEAMTTTDDVDFTLDVDAPAHVAVDSDYEVKIIYYNLGTGMAPDASVTATLPEGTQFVTATDRWGDPLPPGTIDGNTLSWAFDEPMCHKPLDANCGHIVLTLNTDADLAEGTVLTTTASVGTSIVESDTTNNEGSAVSVIGAMAGSTKQVHARHVMPGDVLTYTITVHLAHQPGGGMWEDVIMTDTLPFMHQVRFLGWRGTLSGTVTDGTVELPRQTLRWQGRVQAGEPLTLQYRLGVEGVVTPGTVISNVAMLGWKGGHMQLGPVTTVVTLPHGTMALGPYQGGEMYHEHGVTLTVPPGAVTDTTRFQFRPLFTDTYPTAPPGGLLFANRAFELNAFRFGEPVREFSRPLTITMNYTDADVAGLKRETLQLWTRTGPNGPWAMLGEPARVMSGTLAFTTTHFSQFALFGEAQHHTYLPLVLR